MRKSPAFKLICVVLLGPFLNFHLVFFKKKKERTKEDRESNSGVDVVKTGNSLRTKYVHSFGVFLSHQKVILIVNLQDTELVILMHKGIYIICTACAYIYMSKSQERTLQHHIVFVIIRTKIFRFVHMSWCCELINNIFHLSPKGAYNCVSFIDLSLTTQVTTFHALYLVIVLCHRLEVSAIHKNCSTVYWS